MHTWDDDCPRFALEELPCSDSVLLDQLLPLGDKEVACIEALCDAAGPGPLLVDDVAGGDGVVVATLPDGRHIISLAPTGSPDDPSWVQVNARLICHARHYLLRLLSDRRRWQRECEKLLARIESLEAALPQHATQPRSRSGGTKRVRPR